MKARSDGGARSATLRVLVALALWGCSDGSPTSGEPAPRGARDAATIPGIRGGNGGRGGAGLAGGTDASAGGAPGAPRDASASGGSAWAPRDADLPTRDGGRRLALPDAGIPARDARTDRGGEMALSEAGLRDHGGGDGAGLAGGTDARPPCGALGLKLLTTDLKNPGYATAPPGDPRIFVLERVAGLVVIVDDSGVRATPFLDVSSKMSSEGFEVGLLALVFHPDFATNRTFYVSYTTPTSILRVSRFRVPPATPDVADPASESIVIDIPRLTHHNTSGMLLFGPDGLLHIALGDDDAAALGQDLSSLSGKVLRLLVDPSKDGYAIPPTNPFVGVAGVRPEIWAYGLREPYRFWFDENDLYIADVGDDQREEIDIVPAGTRGGQNFGWPIMEGSICHTPPSGCEQAGLELPAYEFSHDGNTAVIGGGVYRGMALPACFRGRYFFGTYSAGWLRTLKWSGGGVTDVREEPGVLDPGFVSFGQDGRGEILMLGYDQTLHRIIPGK